MTKNPQVDTGTDTIFNAIRKKYQDWQIPSFNSLELKQKRNPICVCVFVINEGEKVQKQLLAMKQYANVADIIVADGGSTDNSLNKKLLQSAGVTGLLTKTGPGKLSAQMRMAFAYALYKGYEGVIVVDGNGKDDISAIPRFIEKLEAGYDHIQGSRFIKGGKAINTPIERLIAVKVVHSPIISIAARHRHTDTTNGFRAYSNKLLQDSAINVFRDIFQTYELHYHLAVESARAKKYKLTEIPVTRQYPKKGKTPTKISPIKGNLHIMGILVKVINGKYRTQTK